MNVPRIVRIRSRVWSVCRGTWNTRVPAFVVCALAVHPITAQDAEPEPSTSLLPGIVARFETESGLVWERIDARPQILPGERPDELLSTSGPWRVRWRGWLDVRTPGQYRVSAWLLGQVRVAIAEQLALDAAANSTAWAYGTPVELPLGWAPLAIEFEPVNANGTLTLAWEGPGFTLEPLATPWLGHTATEAPQAAQPSPVRGRELFETLHCGACHVAPGNPLHDSANPRPAPSLVRVAQNVAPAWLITRLQQDRPTDANQHPAPGERMPHFGLDRSSAETVVHSLWLASASVDRRSQAPAAKHEDATAEQVAAGRALFRRRGCLACHRAEGLGGDEGPVRYDLSAVGDKRSADFIQRWLRAPAEIHHAHQMPVFDLTDGERTATASYLASLRSVERKEATVDPAASVAAHDLLTQGKALIARHRCGACHELPRSVITEATTNLRWPTTSENQQTTSDCLGLPQPSRALPGYALSSTDAAAVRAFLTAFSPDSAHADEATRDSGTPLTHKVMPPSPIRQGAQLFERLGCTACHARGLELGMAGQLDRWSAADATLAADRAALRVPSLDDAGDKLTDAALVEVLSGGSRRRPWLSVSMPRFRLTAEEAAALTAYLIATDRLPDGHQPRTPAGGWSAVTSHTHPAERQAWLRLGGERLVTAEGFGCTSCHAVGRWEPPPGSPGARGTDLSALGQRLREPWFQRWVRNPQRQGPPLEMPALAVPVRGVLEEQLEEQIAAVWHVLSRPGFTPPATGAVQVVRTRNEASREERAVFVRDVFRIGKRAWPNVLAVGLPNRHNLLWDIDTSAWSGWWLGDTARQRNEGKRWYWEPAAASLWELREQTSELAWVTPDGQLHLPLRSGQWSTDADHIEHIAHGIRFAQRLQFASQDLSLKEADGSTRPHDVHVVQSWIGQAGDASRSSGIHRHIEVTQFPPAGHLRLRVLPQLANIVQTEVDASGRRATFDTLLGRAEMHVIDPDRQRLIVGALPEGTSLFLDLSPSSSAVSLEYRLPVASDRYLAPPLPVKVSTAEEIAVVPGWRGKRLPMPVSIMPTGIAQRGDGSLLVSSLQGDVWIGRDTNADGLQDRWTSFSDQLSVPFGLAVVPDDPRAVDVSCKFGLVRLFDDDGDDRADRTEVLAAGWGHTDDYHDWAVGLPRDHAGRYYLGLACQQDDDRSAAAAVGRGAVLQLTPRTPSRDAPHRFAWEPIARGFRFPMGLALDAADRLFATDNQGNFTPFNELNFIRPGARYGFVNALERNTNLPPEHEPPAIALPHPWTRSVNGICFFPTTSLPPHEVAPSPCHFAGQLVGCEYDTRRLVRMSLQEVDGQWQGATYPFSREAQGTEPTFLGPLVCQATPDGGLLVGSIRDSGWGAGQNTGEIVRLDPQGPLPPGLLEVVARSSGFRLTFSAPVARASLERSGAVVVHSFRREVTPDYGGPDLDRRRERPRAITLSPDGKQLDLELAAMRLGFVYEFRLALRVAAGATIWPDEAYFTLHAVPRE